MGESADQIEGQISRTRADLTDNLNELERKVKNVFDWRAQFQERPITMLALAFGGGLVASALLPSRPPRRSDYSRELGLPLHERKRTQSASPNGATAGRAVREALMTIVATTISGVLGEVVRTYRSEFHKPV